ncbi:lysoplasmalogenase family protein [Flavobacterium sp. J27]|uniref:lysoplasmalogenase family protein n=1 Tax=Flavobacterium sp. J27 TaxID=2060419 RepID=UPI0010307F2C|nr:lysoplasmalogenase family protein [Flavobacterium sp. J27]
MPKFNASLLLFTIAGIFYVVASCLDDELLILLSKPIIIPSIVFYYFTQIRRKSDDLFVLSLILFFIGDILYLINIEDYYYFGLFLFLIPYLIVLFFIYKDFRLLLQVREIKKVDVSLVIVMLTILYLIYSLLTLIEFDSKKEFVYVLLFGLELFFMTLLTALVFLYSTYRKNAYLAFTVVSFILSDVFFMLDKQFNILVFKLVNTLAQTLSYYFYVMYFLERASLRRRYLK